MWNCDLQPWPFSRVPLCWLSPGVWICMSNAHQIFCFFDCSHYPCPSQGEQFWCLLFPAPGTGSPQVTPFSFTNTSALCLIGHKEKVLKTELSFHSSVITVLQHFLSSVKIPYHPSAVFPCYMDLCTQRAQMWEVRGEEWESI